MKRIYISHSVQYHNIGINGYNEAKNCQVIATRLYWLLKGTPGVEVFICRPDMSLEQIIYDSNAKKVDLHLSIHSNAGSPAVEGTETLCIFGGEAEKAARFIHEEVMKVMQLLDPDGKHPDRGIKERKDLKELNKTKAPAVLVELGFHTNPDDVSQLIRYRDHIAVALHAGVTKYFEVNPKAPSGDWKIRMIDDALARGVITERRDPNSQPTWAEFLAVLKKLELF